MAKTSKNVLGDQRGQIGKVVGRVVDGVQMYSAHTDAVRNPRTAKQVAHRARFSAVVKLGKSLSGAVNVGFKATASKRKLTSAFNIFVKENMKHITYDAETTQTTIDYDRIELAEGQTPFVSFTGVTFNEALKVTATFTGNSDIPGAREDDSVYVIVYAPSIGMAVMAFGTRADGTVTVNLPTIFGDQTVHVWGFTRTSVDEVVHVENFGIVLTPGECSVSEYVGTGTVTAG